MIEQRACTSCDAGNTPDADFCWRCYARFTTAVPVAATVSAAGAGASTMGEAPPPVALAATPPWQQGGGEAASTALSEPEPLSVSRSPSGGILRLLVVAGVLLGGFLAWQAFTGGPFPDSIRGFQRAEGEAAEAFEDAVGLAAKHLDVTMHGALYERGAGRGLMAILAERTGPTDGFDAAFLDALPVDASISGFERYEVRDASFRCFSHRADLRGAGCFWVDEATVGFVFAVEARIPEALDLTTAVRSAVT